MKTVDELGLRGQERALYEMIWKRTVASQMADVHRTHGLNLISAETIGAALHFNVAEAQPDTPGLVGRPVGGTRARCAAQPASRPAAPDRVERSQRLGRGT